MSCRVSDCERVKIIAKGMCYKHYNQDLKDNPRKPPGPCEVRDCDRLRGTGSKGLCGRHYKLSWKYSMTAEALWSLININGGVCPICKRVVVKDPLVSSSGWHIDHDHACCPRGTSCGKCVRGAICNICNQMLGNAKDNPETLRAGAYYLESSR